MKKYVIALDQGTTSSRAIIFDKAQNIIASAQREITQIYPKESYVEHDPIEIYSSQYGVMMEAIASSGISAEEISCIGITNQRETTIIWDKHTGKPIHNAIVWQCRRTSDICDQLIADGYSGYIQKATGLIIDAYFSGTKLKWLLDNIPGARKAAENGDILFGTVDTYLIWKLTGGKVHITDYTNASRTMLFNINSLDWDDKILDILNIPRKMLPNVCNSSEIYGYAQIDGIDIPISGCAGDQQASLFGQACFNEKDCKCTYGTGCFLLTNTGDKPIYSKNGLLTTIAIGINGKVQYALEGSVFVGGAVIQWLRDEMRVIQKSSDVGIISKNIETTAGVYIVPAFTGLGAPYWDMYARGCIVGLTRGTKIEHIIRAAEESIAYQVNDLVNTMKAETNIDFDNLKVDGGACNDEFLMQFQADILNTNIIRPVIKETTALGAGYLAGLAVGFWKDTDEIKSTWKLDKIFSSSMTSDKRIELTDGWKKAIRQTTCK